jgi:ribosome maturation factor RimP
MSHPIIPKIIDLATPIAETLGLDVVDATFHTNKRPPVLRIDVRNRNTNTSLNDCEQMSRSLETMLDAQEIIPGAYVLEISSPGISRQLHSDREFLTFKGFDVLVKTLTPFQEHTEWHGKLQGRDEDAVYLNQKGRAIAIPRSLVEIVRLA